MPILEEARKLARVGLVEEHVRFENLHDLDGVVKTFGNTAVYDDEPWEEHHDGLDRVRGYYHQLMTALPQSSPLDLNRTEQLNWSSGERYPSVIRKFSIENPASLGMFMITNCTT